MDKSGAGASVMRVDENKGRFASNRKGEAGKGEASRGMEGKQKAHARRAQERLSAHHARGVEATCLWEIRCPELEMPSWTRRAGPVAAWAMARLTAEAIDHDLARVMAFGGKKYVLEMRPYGKEQVIRMRITGFPVWKYSAELDT